MKQKNNGIKRLLEFTGNKRGVLNLSRILSGISAIFILGPFLCVYFAARDLVDVFTGSPLDTESLVRWGIIALALELIGLLLYFCALLCSHVAAFHTEKNLKMAALKHLAKMPMGYFDTNPSGKLRKIIDENSFQTETFIAHQLPDLVGAQVTMVISLILMLIFSPACAVMLNKILYMTSYKMQAEESMRRIDMILTAKTQEETNQPKHPKSYDVVFEDVTFSYETAEQPAISNLSFIAKTGTTTALVGHSGSGKSTTASLIPRFYDAGEGKIKIGGVDIQEIAHKDLMQMVAFVFQNPKLFKDSLLENIRAGRPNATREEVLQAAHMAQCDDILAKFPQGIDTVVGSKGVYLSGGETQRIAIARAILKNAPIIVLDEATAYADPENEQQIQQAFEGLTKGKTVIMIAHRLSTIQDADQILVMKQGKLAEQGTHTSLVEQNGEYARMWENYTKTTQWHIGNEVKVC